MTHTSGLPRKMVTALSLAVAGTAWLGALPAAAAPLSSVSGVSVTMSSPSPAAGALTSYVVQFTTSASGGLSGSAGGKIMISLPSGTGLSELAGSPVTVKGTQVGGCAEASATVASCEIFGGDSVPAKAAVTVTLNGVTNPATPKAYTLSVSTTSDTTPVTSPSYTVTSAGKITGVSAANSPPTTAAGGRTTYSVGFVTSSSGGLSGTTGSKILVDLPAGTGLSALAGSPVTVKGTQVGGCAEVETTVVSCEIFGGESVPAKAAVTVTINGVTNPATAKAYTLSVSTTSDTAPVTSPSYTVTSATKIKALSLKLSSTVTSATNVTYSVQFTTTSALAGDSGSAITITVPAGTGLSELAGSPVTVKGTQVGGCAEVETRVVSCDIFGGETVPPAAAVLVTLNGITNPKTTSPYALKVSTTSDVKTVTSPYCVAASGVPCIARLLPASGPVGTTVTITGINLAGATAVRFNGTAATVSTDTATKITTTVPAGATTGPVTVTTPGGVAKSASDFTVTGT